MRSARTFNGRGPDRGGEARWQKILDAAADSFLEHGYAGATIQDVATRSGMLKGSLYYYIETKEDLLYALVIREHDHGFAYLKEPPEITASSADVRLRFFVLRWMERIVTQRHWSVLVEREFRRLQPDRLKIVARKRRNYHAHLLNIIRHGIRDGVFRTNTPPVVAVNTIFQMLNLTHLWYRDDGALSWAELGEWYADFATHGILADSVTMAATRDDPRFRPYVAELSEIVPNQKEQEIFPKGADSHAAELVTLVGKLGRRSGASKSSEEADDPTTERLLRILHEKPGSRPSELAVGLGVSPQTVTRRVQGLLHRGLLESRSHEHDGRSVRLHLTSAGEREFRARADQAIDDCRWALEGWSADDARTLVDLLGRFVSNVDG